MLALVGMLDSPFVRRVAITMRIYGIPFEHKNFSVFRDPDVMKVINPVSKVPALILADGTRLLDSNLILDYLDQQVPVEKRLLPQGPERWPLLETIGLALVATEKAVQIFYEQGLRPPEFSCPEWVQRCCKQLFAALDLLEQTSVLFVQKDQGLNQAQLTTAVGIRFMQFIQTKLPEPLLPPGRYPQLEALSASCETLPEFQLTPLE